MLRYQWEDAVRFWNSKKGEDREQVRTSRRQKQKFTHTAGSRSFASVAEAEEVSSGQKVRRLQLFDITHRKKDGSPMTTEAGEILGLESMVGFDFKDLVLPRPNILDPAPSNTCLLGVKLKLKFRG
ncbi:rnz [Gossypium arboreum]|uniref:Rnz n=1 Tax=Gossypium arboreum TaxID=29729 RepID=A0A0B0Q3X0_GOSAR|nr:rnz [Gossypium arboreum]